MARPLVLGLWSTDATNHGRPASREQLRLIFESLRTAFPDRRYDIHDLIPEGDMVVSRVTARGTFGEIPALPVDGLHGVVAPPTGKPYAVRQAHGWKIVDGQIVEHWAVRDDLGMRTQLGVLAPH